MEMSKKLAVAYARSATKGSKDLEDQLRRCRIFAATKNYRVLFEYCDDGVSADSLDRDGLNGLLAVIKTDAIDVLLITSLSRLTREPKQLRMLIDEIRSNQVTIQLAP